MSRQHSPQTRAKLSQQKMGNRNPQYGKTPWNKGFHIRTNTGRTHFGTRPPWNKGKKGIHLSPKTEFTQDRVKDAQFQKHRVASISQAMRRHWADPEYRSRVVAKILSSLNLRPNGLERHVASILQGLGLPFKFTGDGSAVIGGVNPDFLWLDKKLIIEVFGDYWHGKGKKNHHQSEIGRKALYRDRGYSCLVLWETTIKKLSNLELAQRIKEWLHGQIATPLA